MALTLTITAENAEDLRTQLHVLLGAAAVAGTITHVLSQGSDAAPVPAEAVKSPAINVPLEILEQEQEVTAKKARRAHRKVKAEPSEPSEPSHDDGALATPAGNGGTAGDEKGTAGDENLFNVPSPELDPVAAQAVKDEILPQLRDLFVAGKVKQVRAILDKFGEGAKSIPEIDAKQFPAIRDFMATSAA
jgi:hypothetical protein